MVRHLIKGLTTLTFKTATLLSAKQSCVKTVVYLGFRQKLKANRALSMDQPTRLHRPACRRAAVGFSIGPLRA